MIGGSEFAGYRALWSSVVLRTLADFWSDYHRLRSVDIAEAGLTRAERYFRSRDGAMVLSLAGLDPTPLTVAALLDAIRSPIPPSRRGPHGDVSAFEDAA